MDERWFAAMRAYWPLADSQGFRSSEVLWPPRQPMVALWPLEDAAAFHSRFGSVQEKEKKDRHGIVSVTVISPHSVLPTNLIATVPVRFQSFL